MHRNHIEAVLGAVVLAIAAIFLWFAYSVADIKTNSGYPITARFDKVGGLKTGSDVRLSGIKVGTVTSMSLDPKTYQAQVEISLRNDLQLPADTVAEISSEGLLGGNFLSLVPGSEETMIPSGGNIKYTQSPVDLVQLLGRFIFSGADKKSENAPQASPAAAN